MRLSETYRSLLIIIVKRNEEINTDFVKNLRSEYKGFIKRSRHIGSGSKGGGQSPEPICRDREGSKSQNSIPIVKNKFFKY